MIRLVWLYIGLQILTINQLVKADLIAFASGSLEGADIKLLDMDNGTIIQLTESPMRMKWSPTWSPNATRLAWFSIDTDVSIVIANSNGQVVQRLTDIPAPYYPKYEVYTGSKLSWSLDGNRLAYSTDKGDLAIVEVMSGAGITLDIDPYSVWSGVSWLVDDSVILGLHGIHFLFFRTDGSIDRIQRIVLDGGTLGIDPVISSDRQKLAFISMPYALACVDSPCFAPAKDFWPQLYIVDLQDTVASRLTDTETIKSRPTWSPDNAWLAYAERKDDNWNLYAMLLEDKSIRQLTRGSSFDFDPSWGKRSKQATAITSASWARVKKLFFE